MTYQQAEALAALNTAVLFMERAGPAGFAMDLRDLRRRFVEHAAKSTEKPVDERQG